jgi:hypothetical protein
VYTLLYSSNYLASAIGPLLSALLFYLWGNSWSGSTLGVVVLVGMGVAIIPLLTVYMFSDDYSLAADQDSTAPLLLPHKDIGKPLQKSCATMSATPGLSVWIAWSVAEAVDPFCQPRCLL